MNGALMIGRARTIITTHLLLGKALAGARRRQRVAAGQARPGLAHWSFQAGRTLGSPRSNAHQGAC